MFEHKIVDVKEPIQMDNVTVTPVLPTRCQVKIAYHGLLDQSGAQDVYLRIGYGTNDQWQDIYDYKMERGSEGWEKVIQVKREHCLRFCFKDGANHWDNNSGLNWSVQTIGF